MSRQIAKGIGVGGCGRRRILELRYTAQPGPLPSGANLLCHGGHSKGFDPDQVGRLAVRGAAHPDVVTLCQT